MEIGIANKRGEVDITELKRYFGGVLDPLNSRSYKARRWGLEEILSWYEDSTVLRAHAMMGPLKDKRVLEIGFGLGAHLIWLARHGASVVGIDISEERVRAAEALIGREGLSDRISLICGDIRDARLGLEGFDIIYGHDILMYMGGSYRPFAGKIHDILKRGGKLIIVEALNNHPAARVYRNIFSPREFRRFTTYFDMEKISIFKEGFKYLEIEPFYLMAPLAFIWKNWFTSKPFFDCFEKGLCVIDALLMRAFPALKRYCWRVVFMAQK